MDFNNFVFQKSSKPNTLSLVDFNYEKKYYISEPRNQKKLGKTEK